MPAIPASVIAAANSAHAAYFPRGPFVSVTLAQWIIESAWGTVVSGANNYFGIKATAAQIHDGHATARWTHETRGGQYIKTVQYFADYPDAEACFQAHARLLATSPIYKEAQNAVTADAYAMALDQDGYATGIPGHPYGETLIAVMKENKLYAYDETPAPAPSAAASPAPLAQPEAPPMFSFASLFALLANAPTVISAAETGIADVQTLLQTPAVKDLEALIGGLFEHTTTAGAASILEPKTATPGKA